MPGLADLAARLRPSRSPRPPAEALASALEGEPVLAAVPVEPDGARWALATAAHLVITGRGAGGVGARTYGWDEIEHGRWDGTERLFTLRPAPIADRADTRAAAEGPGQEPAEIVLAVPTHLMVDGRRRDVDVAPFATTLRQRVEASLVHTTSETLPSGRRVTVSVRRRPDGSLYTATSPALGRAEWEELPKADRAALEALERRARDGVGLPTR